MSYSVRTIGCLELKLPAKEISGDFWNHLYDAVGSESYYLYSDDPTKIEVGDDTVNYDEGRVLDALNAMKSYVVNGEIFYESDDERWKIKLVNEEWEEYSGRVIYEDEKASAAVSKEDQPEYIGNVIDMEQKPNECGRIVLPLGLGYDNKSLVAEKTCESDIHEIYVGIEDDNDGCWQDLLIVQEKYSYGSNNEIIPDEGKYRLLVYGDEERDDSSNEFNIDAERNKFLPHNLRKEVIRISLSDGRVLFAERDTSSTGIPFIRVGIANGSDVLTMATIGRGCYCDSEFEVTWKDVDVNVCDLGRVLWHFDIPVRED